MKTMKKKISLLLFILVIAVCILGLMACNGSFAMDEFIVDQSKFIKEYEVGDEVDLSQLEIKATFNDGTTERIPFDKVTFQLDGKEIGLSDSYKITETAGQKHLVIKYSDQTRVIWITVKEKHIPVLSGVRIQEDSLKKDYIVKDNVTLEGLKVFALYDKDTEWEAEKEIALTDEGVTVFSDLENVTDSFNKIAATVGSKSIRVKYNTFESNNTVTINVSDVVDTVTVVAPESLKTTYKVGDLVRWTGFTATAEYRSGKKEAVSEIKYYLGTSEVDFNALTATRGTKNVVAKAVKGDTVGTKDITVTVENVLTSISVSTYGNLNYVTGDQLSVESFDGVKIDTFFADHQDNGQITLTTEGVSCLGADGQTLDFADLTNTAGNKTVTVSFQGKTATFNVIVTDGETPLKELLVTAPAKTVYTAGEEGVTLAGLEITAKYKDEYSREDEHIDVADFAAYDVKVFFHDRQVADYNDITKILTCGADQQFSVQIRYAGKTASFDIAITNAIVSLSVDASAAKTSYKLDEEADFSGLVVTATLNYGTMNVALSDVVFFDGTTEIVDPDDFMKTVVEQKTVTLSYQGKTASFDISVKDYVVGISFGATTTFTVDVDLTPGCVYSFPDLEVYADYKSGEKVLLTSGYTFENNTINVPTTGKAISVLYGDFYDYDTVTLVVNDVLTAIVVSNVPTFVQGASAEAYLSTIRATGTFAYKGATALTLLQEDGSSFLYGVVSFALKNESNEFETLTQLDLDRIAAESGNRTLRLNYTYNGKTVFCDFDVTVSASASGINEFSLPESLVLYNTTRSTSAAATDKNSKAFENAFFVNNDDIYLVGDDNPFKFVPNLLQVNMGVTEVTPLTTYQTTSKVYYEGSALDERVNGIKKTFYRGDTIYVVENFVSNTFDFTEDAIGKVFTLSVLPSKNQFDYDDGDVTAVEWTVKVVDGYNVTDSRELCLLEQSTRTYWNSIKAELGLTGVRPSSIILHQNTIVTKDSIPTAFYYTLPSNYNIKYKYTDGSSNEHVCAPEDVPAEYGGGHLSRTFLWDDEYGLFEYNMMSGKTFTIHGNFFDIDLSRMPLVAAFEPVDGTVSVPADFNGTYYGQYMSKVSFLEVRGIEGTTGAGDETFTFNNFAVKGNAAINQVLVDSSSNIKQGADSPVFGGGLIFVKTRYCTSDIVNIHAHACFIPFYSRNETVVNSTNAKAYDSFQNALFVNCDSVNNLHNCYFKRAGGPLMILVENSKKVNDVDVKLIPKVYADDYCELESMVTGMSQWFVTYGVTGNVTQLAALDPLLNGYFARTLISGGKFNVIAVTIEEGGGGSAGTQAYMSYKNNAVNRLDGQATFETTKVLADNGFGAFFVMGDTYCAPFTSDNENYSLVKWDVNHPADVATDMTVQGAFRDPDNQYVAIYAGGMGILAELY